MSDLKSRLRAKRDKVEMEVDGVGKVWLRRLTSAEMFRIKSLESGPGMMEMFAQSVVDENGEQVCTPEEVKAIDFAIIKLVTDRALQLNSLDKADPAKK